MPSVRDNNRHVADVEGTSVPMRCWKCEGTLRAERAIDMKRGVSILLYEESTKVCTV
jgi:hypothetical protein